MGSIGICDSRGPEVDEVGVTESIVVEMGQRKKGVNLLEEKKKSFPLHYKAPLMTEELNNNIVRLVRFIFQYGAAELLKRPFAFHWDILWKFSCYCMDVTAPLGKVPWSQS